MMLNVAEQFYSIQGEGMSMGIPSYFLRLKSCNLLCGGKGTDKDGELHDGATWRCDTVEVWLKGSQKSYEEILKDFGDFMPASHLIITGGEPLLQQNKIIGLLDMIGEMYVEIETNGTLVPSKELRDRVMQWNVSPKLSNSGVPFDKRVNPEAITILRNCFRSQFKFVVTNEAEVVEAIKTYIEPFHLAKRQVWLMPAGDNQDQLNQVSWQVAELAKQYGFGYSHRLHITLWNKKTGV